MLEQIRIDNFKSIKSTTINFKNTNVLIGSNGAGKSNFISFFKLLNSIVEKKLQNYIAENDGIENLLHFGQKESESIFSEVIFDSNNGELFNLHKYGFLLKPTVDNRVFFENEFFGIKRVDQKDITSLNNINNSNSESNLFEDISGIKGNKYIINKLKTLKIYHFHDTSISAKIKKICNIEDNEILKEDGSNLAAFLYKIKIKNELTLKKIENTIKLVAPYFDSFVLKPTTQNDDYIKLLWREKNSDSLFTANNLSDGTLRMICLITLFLQNESLDILIIDEPELGLHPFAIHLLYELIDSYTKKGKQIIISTQSITLIDKFSIDDIIVVDKKGKESVFKRLKEEEFKDWIDDYSTGELFEKNMFGGRP